MPWDREHYRKGTKFQSVSPMISFFSLTIFEYGKFWNFCASSTSPLLPSLKENGGSVADINLQYFLCCFVDAQHLHKGLKWVCFDILLRSLERGLCSCEEVVTADFTEALNVLVIVFRSP